MVAAILLLFLLSTTVYRVDFSLGHLGFKLVPSLIMSAVLVPTAALLLLNDPGKVKKDIGIITLYSILLVSICGLSLLWGYEDILQFKRLLLFSLVLFASVCFAVILGSLDPDRQRSTLCKFVRHGIAIYIMFSAFQVAFFKRGEFFLTMANPFINNFFAPYPQTIGSLLPRLSGGFIDPNLAGYFLALIFFISSYLGLSRYRIISFILLILTFSRSAIFGFILSYLASLVLKAYRKDVPAREAYLNLTGALGYTAVSLVLTTAVLLVLFKYADLIASVISVRFGTDLQAGSGKIHVDLIGYALSQLDNPFSLFCGHGFNSSFIYVNPIFGGGKYANFHSEFITFLFEEGIVGLAAYLSIYLFIATRLAQDLRARRLPLVSLLMSFFLFNIFYQQYMFFYYWIGLFTALVVEPGRHAKEALP